MAFDQYKKSYDNVKVRGVFGQDGEPESELVVYGLILEALKMTSLNPAYPNERQNLTNPTYPSRWLLLILLVQTVFFTGCGSIPEVSALPNIRPAVTDRTIKVNYSFDETFEAAKEALIRLNLPIKFSDNNSGVIKSKGRWTAKNMRLSELSLVFFVEEIDTKPTTRVDLLLIPWARGQNEYMVDTTITELQRVLLTYR